MDVDYNPYPLKGYIVELYLAKRGLNNDNKYVVVECKSKRQLGDSKKNILRCEISRCL
jgi:hypothetical protein